MKEVTELMIRRYKIMQLRRDFMGYEVDKKKQLSFHHLLVSRQDAPEFNLGRGYVQWNGALLRQTTSHTYLHLIENVDKDIFDFITMELIQENQQGHLDPSNWGRINSALESFEREHCSDRTNKSKFLIKEDYINDRYTR